jgi:hypothetical protein
VSTKLRPSTRKWPQSAPITSMQLWDEHSTYYDQRNPFSLPLAGRKAAVAVGVAAGTQVQARVPRVEHSQPRPGRRMTSSQASSRCEEQTGSFGPSPSAQLTNCNSQTASVSPAFVVMSLHLLFHAGKPSPPVPAQTLDSTPSPCHYRLPTAAGCCCARRQQVCREGRMERTQCHARASPRVGCHPHSHCR